MILKLFKISLVSFPFLFKQKLFWIIVRNKKTVFVRIKLKIFTCTRKKSAMINIISSHYQIEFFTIRFRTGRFHCKSNKSANKETNSSLLFLFSRGISSLSLSLSLSLPFSTFQHLAPLYFRTMSIGLLRPKLCPS